MKIALLILMFFLMLVTAGFYGVGVADRLREPYATIAQLGGGLMLGRTYVGWAKAYDRGL